MAEDLAVERHVWQCFFAYTIAHNPLSPEEMYKRSLVNFCNDCAITKPVRASRSSLGPKFTPTPVPRRAAPRPARRLPPA